MSSSVQDENTDSFSFTHTSSSIEQEQFSISNFIDDFITKTLPELPSSYSNLSRQHQLLDLSEGILELILSFLDQRSVLSVIVCCSSFIIPARKRLYNRIAVVNGIDEVKLLRSESILPTTIVLKNKFIDCLDVIRMGDPKIGDYVKELICFADLNWSNGEEFTLNDSWYLTAPLLRNLRSLVFPKLPLSKYQILQTRARFNIKTLCIGFLTLKEENLKSYDNSVLTFPSVENLIINLEQNEKMDDIILLSRLLVYGEVLRNLKRLTISGCLNQAISPNNVKPRLRYLLPNIPPPLDSFGETELPQTPVKQTFNFEESKDKELFRSARLSFKDRLKHSFKSPTTPLMKVTREGSSAFPSPTVEVPKTSKAHNVDRSKLSHQNQNVNSSVWSEILVQFGSFGKLNLESFTLDKVLLQDFDIDCLLKYLNLSKLETLELSNVLIKYDELEDKLESKGFPLQSLAPYLNLKSLSLDVRFQSSNCGIDCFKYGDLQIKEFLAAIAPLKNLHLVTYDQKLLEPEYLTVHQFSMRRISLSMPEKLKGFIRLLKENLRLLNEFEHNADFLTSSGEEFEKIKVSKSLIKLLNNSLFNTVLVDDVLSPNLFKLLHYNESKNRIFNEHKYQLLNFFGDQFDDYVRIYPNLEEISFFGVKFRTV